MRSRIARHLQPVLSEHPDGAAGQQMPAPCFALARADLRDGAGDGRGQGLLEWPIGAAPPEFNWRDYASMLLGVAAEIEHSLMVQYLFAAYSLGGPQVPPKREMGHMLIVQTLRPALALPLHLDREDYPWGSGFYPFQFTLQRLTLDSL